MSSSVPSSSSSAPTSAPSTTAPPSTTYSTPTTSFSQSTGANGETQVLDDTDPSIIYTARGSIPWNLTSDPNAYNHTLHQTSCNTCTATLLFNGTGISLTSMLSPQGSLFIVILDGTTAGPFTLNSLTSQPAVVYTVENLQYAQHNATFMKSSSNPSDQTLFNIDSITIISRPPLTGSSYVAPTASGRTSATNTQTGSTPTDSSAPVAQAKSSPPIGAIVGGSIGGVLLIGVLIAWFIIMYRRRSREEEKETTPYADDKYADRYAKGAYAQDRRSQDRRSQDRPVQSRQSHDRYANRGYSRDAYADNTRDAYASNTRAGYVGGTREAYNGNTREAYGGSTREAYPSSTRDAYGRSSRDHPTERAVSSRSTRDPNPTAKAASRSSRRY